MLPSRRGLPDQVGCPPPARWRRPLTHNMRPETALWPSVHADAMQRWIAGLGNVKLPHMSWSGQRRGYHHGNLREALTEAALELIAQKGPAGFTIAEAARLAGVSPAAPYRHFRDAEALLAEV